MIKLIRLHEQGIEWLHKRVTKKQFLIISSILVGITSGLAAVLLKSVVHYIHKATTTDHNIPFQYFIYLGLPAIGILLSVFFVHRFMRGKLERGSAHILHAIARKNSKLPPENMFSHLVTSALTVGFGGSAGLESPIVGTGAAIGSNYGNTYHLTYKDRTLLLASGVAAGIGAAFNAPIAGVLFALEVLIADATVSAFIPIMIAAAAGTLISKIILSDSVILSLGITEPFNYQHVHWYVALGLLCGFIAVYYSRMFPQIEKFTEKIGNKWIRAISGGAVLALLIWMFPSLYGEGYSSIVSLTSLQPEMLIKNSVGEQWLDSQWLILIFIGIIMLLKVFATGVTLGSGGNGGNFAPSLFVGAYLGFFFSKSLTLLHIDNLPIVSFTVVGMAGILTGIFHAPLTGIFLIAEVTGGYELMIPLMIVSALSYTITKYFEPFSMDTKRLATRGFIFTHDRDRNILSRIKVRTMLETDFQSVKAEMTLGELVEVIAHSPRSLFPVLDDNETLQGIVQLDDIREIMFKPELYDQVTVKNVMHPPVSTISIDENMYSAMKKFDELNAWNFPVIDEGKYAGFISKSGVLTRYRKLLKSQTINQED